MKTIIGIIIGAIIGIPLSYYFQAELLQNFVSLPKYIANIGDLMSNTKYVDLTPNIFKSMGIFATVGGAIGLIWDFSSKSKK